MCGVDLGITFFDVYGKCLYGIDIVSDEECCLEVFFVEGILDEYLLDLDLIL